MQEQAPGAPKGVRMARGPDGSKGFAPGRGRALPPAPASSTPPEAPGSVSALIPYFICGRAGSCQVQSLWRTFFYIVSRLRSRHA